jgi:two-component system cell cycle response regulator DivK
MYGRLTRACMLLLAADEGGAMAETILVVDDNEANLRLINAVLKTRGYDLLEARSGEAALEMLAAQRPSLVLMDVQMPGLSGIDVARTIRAMPALAELPLVAITAMAMKGDREEIMAAGFNDYLAKPYKMGELLALVARWLPAEAEY